MPQPVSVTLKRTVWPDARVGMLLRVGGINIHGGSGDEKLPAFGHGIAGVDREVHDDLLQHAGVGFQRGKAGGIFRLHRDVLAQQAGEHVGQVAEDGIEVNNLGLQHLLAAEHQQLARQGRGAAGGV